MLVGTPGDHLGQRYCLKQGQIRKIVYGSVQMGGEYLQEWKIHSLSSQHVPVFNHI